MTRLPPPPPKRTHPQHSPRSRKGALTRARELERGQGPSFDPARRGTWRGSSRDLVVNGRLKLPEAGDDRILRYVDVDGYKLLTWDVNQRYGTGQSKVGYAFFTPEGKILFSGEDIGIAPSDPIDSDAALRAVLGWLTLKPGDTDSEFFERYTPEQMAFAEGPAEELQMWSIEPERGEEWWGEFKDLDWKGPRFRMRKNTGMRRNAGAGDYLPEHLRHVEFRYNDPPEENGDSVRYGSFESTRHAGGGEPEPGEWYLVNLASGSDYNGGSVTQSNYRVLKEELEREHPEGETPAVWATTYGGHGTYGILVVWDQLDESIQEMLNALDDYPLISEDDHSHLEVDEQNASWENWGRRDFLKELVGYLNGYLATSSDREIDELELSDEAAFGLFRLAAEVGNIYWEDQQGSGQYIDMDRVAGVASDLITGKKAIPGWAANSYGDAWDSIEKIRRELGIRA
jgi:hypothetical protein